MIDRAAAAEISITSEGLAGKRLALLGFDSSDADAIAAVLNHAGAFCRNIPNDSGGAAALSRSFDGALVYLYPGSGVDLRSLAAAAKPILVVATHAVLAERIASIRSHAVDCVGYPCSAAELLLRSCCMVSVPMPGRAPDAGPPVVLVVDDD